jgi:hypothetical protein
MGLGRKKRQRRDLGEPILVSRRHRDRYRVETEFTFPLSH